MASKALECHCNANIPTDIVLFHFIGTRVYLCFILIQIDDCVGQSVHVNIDEDKYFS